jgi:hypothetical protein
VRADGPSAKISPMRWAAWIGVVVVAGVAAASASGTGRAAWPPRSAKPQAVARAVAAHTAARYFVSEYGGRFVAVKPGRLELTSGNRTVRVQVVAIRRTGGAKAGVVAHGTGRTVAYTMCGSARGCSIPGAATLVRGRLVRRIALELALDTFAYAPTADAVLVFAPPAPGKSKGFVVYLGRTDLKQQLAQPRARTLPVDPPPYPADPDRLVAATIDRLTLPHVFDWGFAALKGGGQAMLLEPLIAQTSPGRSRRASP